jgi:UDP-N-acetylglucosamine 2-epimerase (non-hydrolysing)/GDP/UDP-N,N'-diacetylbacillosamine 2-epimerase (hydrolysing)
MKNKKKILAVTSIRSDYDLMVPLYSLLHADADIELKLLVAGAHMSYSYGHTVDLIERDGFDILQRMETLLDSNSIQSRVKSAGILFLNAVDVVSDYNPDLIIYAGDREDVIISAIIAGYLGIPSLHFYGGDHAKDGYIDNPIRHAASKLSTVHMVTLQQHRDRLLRMGEANKRIHVVGNLSLDSFASHVQTPMHEIKSSLGIRRKFSKHAVVIFHPTSEEITNCHAIIENILISLKNCGIFAFVSFPNTDPGNKAIIETCRTYEHDDNFYFYKNLDRETFLSIYKSSCLIVGNSSSGVLESASVPVAAVNVGQRQVGRFAPENVLFCKTDFASIEFTIDVALSPEFSEIVKKVRNPYGDGESAKVAYGIIKNNDFKQLLAKTEDPLQMG